MRRLWICACAFALALPCAAWAGNGRSPARWQNLATLHAGEKIQVVDTNHRLFRRCDWDKGKERVAGRSVSRILSEANPLAGAFRGDHSSRPGIAAGL